MLHELILSTWRFSPFFKMKDVKSLKEEERKAVQIHSKVHFFYMFSSVAHL